MGAARTRDPAVAVSALPQNAALLPYFEPYSHENNDGVRLGIVYAIGEMRTRVALQLLSNVLYRPPARAGDTSTDGKIVDWRRRGVQVIAKDGTSSTKKLPAEKVVTDVTGEALHAIARDFNRNEILQWGGRDLQQNVLQLARYEPQYPEALWLAATFGTPQSKAALQEVRRRAKARDTMSVIELLPKVSLAFATDIALAEAGDTASFLRLKKQLASGKQEDRFCLCNALFFVQNKDILRLVPPFLSDERPVFERDFFVGDAQGMHNYQLASYRIADLAAHALAYKMQNYPTGDLYEGEPLTPKQLKRVRYRFTRWISGNPLSKKEEYHSDRAVTD